MPKYCYLLTSLFVGIGAVSISAPSQAQSRHLQNLSSNSYPENTKCEVVLPKELSNQVLPASSSSEDPTKLNTQDIVVSSELKSLSKNSHIFVYIGMDKEEAGRLILINLKDQRKTILTPKQLKVINFEPYPKGDRILFSATSDSTFCEALYTVTTGISNANSIKQSDSNNSDGKIDMVLEAKVYEHLQFDLSPDGETIVINRVIRYKRDESALWVVRATGVPQLLPIQEVDKFTITPDSKAVAVRQRSGTVIFPFQFDNDTKPVSFQPQFGLVKAFSRDGSQAAMVKSNSDLNNPNKSLFLVTNEGVSKELLQTTGSILNCQFDNVSPTLYCLTTQVTKGEQHVEVPSLLAINLNTGEQKRLLTLPQNLANVQMSLSSDGSALLFDQPTQQSDALKATESNYLWILPLGSAKEPVKMPFRGLSPRWL